MKDSNYTEIEEKRTSKLGYLILSALFIFLIIAGQTIFHDIGNIPIRPESPSHCAATYTQNLQNINYKPRCSYNTIDRQYNIDTQITSIQPDIETITQYNKEITSKNNQINSNERTLSTLLQQYDISLQETIANEDTLMDKPGIKTQIIKLNTANENLNTEIKELETKRDAIVNKISPAQDRLKTAYDAATKDYRNQMVYYNFKTFILKLLFILPIFLIFLKYYLEYKKKDSPYTIIITAIFFAATILFLQIALIFLYSIIPEGLIEKILNIFLNSSILRYILYYGVILAVILILGGIVYYIQKNIYDPKRVAIRSLKNNKCPNCSFDLSLSDNYCPYCGREIKTKCSTCKNPRYKDLNHCPTCGKTEESSNPKTTPQQSK